MWWLFVFMGLLMLYSKLDDIIDAFKSSDPAYQKEKEKLQREHLDQRFEITQRLEELIGAECQLESQQFYLMSLPGKLQVKVVAVDSDWVEFTTDKKKTGSLIMKIEDISTVSRIL